MVEGFNMFKPKTYSKLVKTMKYGPLDVIGIAGASAASGLAVGCLLDDKKNRKAKQKESISQMIGNIIIPIACVTTGSILAGKAIDAKLFGEITKKSQTVIKVASSAGAFLAGVIGGNKAANKIVGKLFKSSNTAAPIQRGIKPADLTAHIDDTCATISIAGKGVATCEKIARVIPLALCTVGVSTGLTKEKH
ncbi:hypothetical protein tpqmel_0992 [Candidatus Gastranaerophilus sp. (ex Termes propinquus)]|nr:hypothetical protein tpqmel_0992 [Candidatus Gastranaerophilus sp. (ex Termes propinquus)]